MERTKETILAKVYRKELELEVCTVSLRNHKDTDGS